jgi:hypothetical protein
MRGKSSKESKNIEEGPIYRENTRYFEVIIPYRVVG